jgi:hypothetical protein
MFQCHGKQVKIVLICVQKILNLILFLKIKTPISGKLLQEILRKTKTGNTAPKPDVKIILGLFGIAEL